MISAKKFKESFDKMLTSLCTDLLLPSEFMSMYNDTFENKISKSKAKEVRDNAVNTFKGALTESFKKMCEEYSVSFKVFIK